MTGQKHTFDAWDVASLNIWLLLMVVGLFPEASYFALREWGHVVSQSAFVNNPWIITLAISGFWGWFTYACCVRGGDSEDGALGKGVQMMVLGLVAFLPVQIEQLPFYFSIPILFYRRLILAIVATKVIVWVYMVTLLIRYYLFSGNTVFTSIPLVFPSAFHKTEDE